jgi:uncharacterized integral membrane protein (TIGR00698 family)
MMEGDPERTARPALAAIIACLPGLALASGATAAAFLASIHAGLPLTMMALLIGLALNFLQPREALAPGLAFAAGTLLRISIVLLGMRITFDQVAGLGPAPLAALLLIVAATIGAALLAARLLGASAAFGALAGGAVAICGASAALALAALLGDRRVSRPEVALVLVGIAAMSALAMLLYPILAGAAGLGDLEAGFLMGASIHEVAHSLGAGYSFSAAAGEAATIVKMSRVALLAPVLLAIGFAFGGSVKGVRLPWFVLAFFAVAALNSIGIFPGPVREGAAAIAAILLALAVAATGIRLPLRSLFENSARSLLILALASLTALGLSILALRFLI